MNVSQELLTFGSFIISQFSRGILAPHTSNASNMFLMSLLKKNIFMQHCITVVTQIVWLMRLRIENITINNPLTH